MYFVGADKKAAEGGRIAATNIVCPNLPSIARPGNLLDCCCFYPDDDTILFVREVLHLVTSKSTPYGGLVSPVYSSRHYGRRRSRAAYGQGGQRDFAEVLSGRSRRIQIEKVSFIVCALGFIRIDMIQTRCQCATGQHQIPSTSDQRDR